MTLFLALASPPIQPPLVCTGDEINDQWLQGCMYTVAEAQRNAQGPADAASLKVFLAERDLAGSFVRLCEETAQKGLGKPGWWPPSIDDCPEEVRVRWLDACVRDARAIVPGSSRRAVLAHFVPEGGLRSVGHESFIHQRCSVLKLDVTFAGDTVRSVSPYIGFAAFD